MNEIEKAIVENQLAMMRALGYDARSPYVRDVMRQRVAITERALANAERDERLRHEASMQTRKIITRTGRTPH